MTAPKVSVIVPVYNTEKYLKQCIDSISSQTLSQIEIILVDDGSKEECALLCDELAEILAEEGDRGKLIGDGLVILELELDDSLVVNEEFLDLFIFEVRDYIAVLLSLLARSREEG